MAVQKAPLTVCLVVLCVRSLPAATSAFSAGISSTDPQCPTKLEEDGAASLVQMPLDRARGKRVAFSAMHPVPSLLKWRNSSCPRPGVNCAGTLTVHMDPADHGSPTLELEVIMMFATVQPAPLGPLLIHCGGPGTDATCSLGQERGLRTMGYDVWSISQRGVGGSKPSMKCSRARLPATGKDHYEISDFSDCPCAYADGTPLVIDRLVDIDPSNETQVRSLLSHITLNRERCFKWEKMQLTGSNGKVYNFWEWSGTQMLANDINVMRQAVGAEKMSILGFSYGTAVGAVYASTFPDRVFRVVLDGNMDPLVTKSEYATNRAAALQQAFAKILFECEHADACTMIDPQTEFYDILDALNSEEGMTALTKSGNKFRLTSGLLIGTLVSMMFDNTAAQWVDVLTTLTELSTRRNGSAAERQRALTVERVLNKTCAVNGMPTWYEYGTCVGDWLLGEHNDNIMNAVDAQDTSGRWTLEDVIGGWRGIQQEYGVVGSTAYIAHMSPIYATPAIPTPMAPMGSPSVPAVVIGNLYDPATGYTNSQKMHAAFPSGSMMTWQGVGHISPDEWMLGNGTLGRTVCGDQLRRYFLSGVLPQNGLTCRGFDGIFEAASAARPQ